MIYDPAAFASVVEGEAPDFRLSRGSARHPFGVEVTELYYSPSDARIANIPGYATHLINGGAYRHKDDVSALAVNEIEILGPDGVPKAKARAVMRKMPPLTTYVAQIVDTIARKEARLCSYMHGVEHTNLIILDGGNRLTRLKVEDVSAVLLTQSLRDSLTRTGFREIFLVTGLSAEKRYSFRLRALLLLADAYLFGGALSEARPDAVITVDEELHVLAAYISWRGGRPFLANSITGNLQVILGNAGVSFGDDGTHLYDFADYPLPRDAVAVDTSPSGEDVDLFRFASEYTDRHVFKTSWVTDARPSTYF